ncbi:hypothetical protein CISG_00077 [Coccidioides immitis RMSCC 3703]|uniref:Uncharacterized protein n=1 Tax=Coccidioides immitis RMSCC 3703 TaxID=454286 RepID=A0A0J8TE23_COCIT|nr:hypothetical protein CISG_00077 [Coccidioides immitis RMSCC 3703]
MVPGNAPPLDSLLPRLTSLVRSVRSGSIFTPTIQEIYIVWTLSMGLRAPNSYPSQINVLPGRLFPVSLINPASTQEISAYPIVYLGDGVPGSPADDVVPQVRPARPGPIVPCESRTQIDPPVRPGAVAVTVQVSTALSQPERENSALTQRN